MTLMSYDSKVKLDHENLYKCTCMYYRRKIPVFAEMWNKSGGTSCLSQLSKATQGLESISSKSKTNVDNFFFNLLLV